MAKRDYYETLGISKGSSDADIKKAFRSKARELHPDKNSGSAKAEEEFQDYDNEIQGNSYVEYIDEVEETDEPLSPSYLNLIFEEERGKL